VPLLSSIDDIVVSGGFGDAPEVTLDGASWPVRVDETVSKVLVEGSGVPLTASGYLTINYYGLNARTGEMFDSSWSEDRTPYTSPANWFITGFTNSLVGKNVGSRVVMAITSADGYDANGGQESAGIEVGDTLIFVVDIIAGQLPGPSGETITPTDEGLPTVAGGDGAPTVTIPADTAAPTELVVQPLIKGTGAEVAATDDITVNYVGVRWDTGEVIDTTWAEGVGTAQTGALTDVIEGWKQGLLGQTVGSRVLLVIPPALAFPDGNQTLDPPLPAGVTLVYVVDILFTEAGE
jgi:peptidylprolyl isomerase